MIKNKCFSKLQAKTLYIGKEYFEIYDKESSSMKPDTLIRILEENMSLGIMIPNIDHGISLMDPDSFNQLVEKWIVKGDIPDGKIIK